MSETSAAVFRQ